MKLENVLPMDIEQRSFAIISEELGQMKICLLYTSSTPQRKAS